MSVISDMPTQSVGTSLVIQNKISVVVYVANVNQHRFPDSVGKNMVEISNI